MNTYERMLNRLMNAGLSKEVAVGVLHDLLYLTLASPKSQAALKTLISQYEEEIL